MSVDQFRNWQNLAIFSVLWVFVQRVAEQFALRSASWSYRCEIQENWPSMDAITTYAQREVIRDMAAA